MATPEYKNLKPWFYCKNAQSGLESGALESPDECVKWAKDHLSDLEGMYPGRVFGRKYIIVEVSTREAEIQI